MAAERTTPSQVTHRGFSGPGPTGLQKLLPAQHANSGDRVTHPGRTWACPVTSLLRESKEGEALGSGSSRSPSAAGPPPMPWGRGEGGRCRPPSGKAPQTAQRGRGGTMPKAGAESVHLGAGSALVSHHEASALQPQLVRVVGGVSPD